MSVCLFALLLGVQQTNSALFNCVGLCVACVFRIKGQGIRKVCLLVWFINSFARDTCVSELPADIKGEEKLLRNGGGEGLTDRRKVTVGGERSDI